MSGVGPLLCRETLPLARKTSFSRKGPLVHCGQMTNAFGQLSVKWQANNAACLWPVRKRCWFCSKRGNIDRNCLQLQGLSQSVWLQH